MRRHEVVFAAPEQHPDEAKANSLISAHGPSLQKSRTQSRLMRLYATTLFLPSPAVPYVRLSLFIATRWEPLPPRRSCDTQAHRFALFAPVPRGPSLRGVVLSASIIAPTTPSASLIDSPRFQISTLIRAAFVIQG